MLTADLAAIEFAAAHLMDDDRNCNTVVLDHEGVRCTPRMARIHNADAAVLALAAGELPEAVQSYQHANTDNACGRCWITSSRSGQHPECAAKIKRWFAARQKLIEYGVQLKSSLEAK